MVNATKTELATLRAMYRSPGKTAARISAKKLTALVAKGLATSSGMLTVEGAKLGRCYVAVRNTSNR